MQRDVSEVAAAPAFGDPFRVAELAARRDLRAAGDRVPGRIRPLDCAVVTHGPYVGYIGSGYSSPVWYPELVLQGIGAQRS